MPIVNAENTSAQLIFQQVIAVLKQHRLALEACEGEYKWSSGITAADLMAAPISMPAAGAQAIINALADAHAEYVNHSLGLPAVLPATGYRYGDSQATVIGPL